MSRVLRRALAASAAVAVLALPACGHSTGAQQAPPLMVDSTAAGSPTSMLPATPTPTSASTSSAYRLSIAKIAASSTLIPLGLNPDQTVEVPPVSQPQQAGYYANGPVPGDRGPAVVLGHVNGGGRPGVFAHLADLTVGDEVDVARPDGRTAVFQVYRTQVIEKDVFPTSAVYSDTAGAELRLLTCGGELNRAAHSYLSNVIVYASLVTEQ